MEIKKYLFHDLTQSELQSLCLLYNQIRKETETWIDKSLVTLEEFEEMIEVETIYIAYDKQRMIGFLTFYVPDNFIHLFFIDANHQGTGIGSYLLNEVISDFYGEEISLKCLIHNHLGIKFYQSKGFIITKEYIENEPDDCYLMVRK